MQTTEIVELVQQRAELDSAEDAQATVTAVLKTLALRDLKEEREDFAAQLPKALGEVLTVGTPDTKERFDAAEMVRRVGQHTGTTVQESQRRTHAAFSVLLEAVSDGQAKQLLEALSEDYAAYARWNE